MGQSHDEMALKSSSPGPGILVPEHFVPTPGTISAQAQAFLSYQAPVGSHQTPISRDDLEGWRAYRALGDRGITEVTKSHIELYPAEVITHQLGAIKLYEIVPQNLDADRDRSAILYVHGGGWVVGGGQAAVCQALQMAGLSKTRVFSVDYRLVPEVAFPTPVEDVFAAYRFLLTRYAAERLALFGASAGANLAPAAILMGRDEGMPLPAACALHSCPSEIAFLGDTFHTNFMVDTVLRQREPELGLNYANGHDPKDPLLSPVYANFASGFPPSILTSGTRDLLLSSTVMMHRALLRGGIKAELHVWEAMTHAPFIGAPEEVELYQEHIRFMLHHMKA